MSTIWSFTDIENKHDVYGGKYCMKKFCEFSTEHVMKIIKLLTNERPEAYENAKICYAFFLGFIKTTNHRPTDYRPTDPPTTFHLPTDPPTIDRLLSTYDKIEDQILNMFCIF